MEYVEEVRRITIHRLAEEVAAMVSKLKVKMCWGLNVFSLTSCFFYLAL